jgi:hypothetical protein
LDEALIREKYTKISYIQTFPEFLSRNHRNYFSFKYAFELLAEQIYQIFYCYLKLGMVHAF